MNGAILPGECLELIRAIPNKQTTHLQLPMTKTKEIEVNIEITDTYGGEANYSWVNRSTIWMPADSSDLSIVRRVKKELGYTNHRCKVSNFGDEIHLDPSGECVRIFVTWQAY